MIIMYKMYPKQTLVYSHNKTLTVPIRRNLTGNANRNGNGTDTEWVQNGNGTVTERVQNRNMNACRMGTECGSWMERIQNGYRTGMERIQNGYKTGTGTRVEWVQNLFCQVFPVRFLLIGTVHVIWYMLLCNWMLVIVMKAFTLI